MSEQISETRAGYTYTYTARPAGRPGRVAVTVEVLVPAGCDAPEGRWEDSRRVGPTGATGLEGGRELSRGWECWVAEWEQLAGRIRGEAAAREAEREAELGRRCREWTPPPPGVIVTPDGRRIYPDA